MYLVSISSSNNSSHFERSHSHQCKWFKGRHLHLNVLLIIKQVQFNGARTDFYWVSDRQFTFTDNSCLKRTNFFFKQCSSCHLHKQLIDNQLSMFVVVTCNDYCFINEYFSVKWCEQVFACVKLASIHESLISERGREDKFARWQEWFISDTRKLHLIVSWQLQVVTKLLFSFFHHFHCFNSA